MILSPAWRNVYKQTNAKFNQRQRAMAMTGHEVNQPKDYAGRKKRHIGACHLPLFQENVTYVFLTKQSGNGRHSFVANGRAV